MANDGKWTPQKQLGKGNRLLSNHNDTGLVLGKTMTMPSSATTDVYITGTTFAQSGAIPVNLNGTDLFIVVASTIN